jgi:hypothetical protein
MQFWSDGYCIGEVSGKFEIRVEVEPPYIIRIYCTRVVLYDISIIPPGKKGCIARTEIAGKKVSYEVSLDPESLPPKPVVTMDYSLFETLSFVGRRIE